MYLVQILLPLNDNEGKPFPDATLRSIHKELCDRFGGVTAYNRAPAEEIWRGGGGEARDDIVIVEVMAHELGRHWWQAFRLRVERQLDQDKLIVRAQAVEKL